jgi:hypothetical protein
MYEFLPVEMPLSVAKKLDTQIHASEFPNILASLVFANIYINIANKYSARRLHEEDELEHF